MMMKKQLCFPVFLIMLILGQCVLAEETSINIIELHSRTTEEIIPVLKPLLDNNTAITGTGYQIIIRATPSKLAEIRQIIDQLDKTPKSLLISVKHGNDLDLEELNAEISGQIKIDDKATIETSDNSVKGDQTRVRIKINQTASRNNENNTYQVRVLEGHVAHIQTVKSIPLPERTIINNGGNTVTQDSIRYRDITSGFYALPRVRGKIVTVDISPQKESLSKHGGGVINTQAIHTSVTGELGKWIDIGGVSEESDNDSSGLVFRTKKRNESNYWILIKIEEIAHK